MDVVTKKKEKTCLNLLGSVIRFDNRYSGGGGHVS